MQYSLSFATIKVHDENIVEVIVNEDIEVSLEMVEEADLFFEQTFTGPIGILVNKINLYTYSFEAQLTIASHADIKGMAVVQYNTSGHTVTEKLSSVRAMDKWNLATFCAIESGSELPYQQAMSWLQQQLALAPIS